MKTVPRCMIMSRMRPPPRPQSMPRPAAPKRSSLRSVAVSPPKAAPTTTAAMSIHWGMASTENWGFNDVKNDSMDGSPARGVDSRFCCGT